MKKSEMDAIVRDAIKHLMNKIDEDQVSCLSLTTDVERVKIPMFIGNIFQETVDSGMRIMRISYLEAPIPNETSTPVEKIESPIKLLY